MKCLSNYRFVKKALIIQPVPYLQYTFPNFKITKKLHQIASKQSTYYAQQSWWNLKEKIPEVQTVAKQLNSYWSKGILELTKVEIHFIPMGVHNKGCSLPWQWQNQTSQSKRSWITTSWSSHCSSRAWCSGISDLSAPVSESGNFNIQTCTHSDAPKYLQSLTM